MGIVLVPAAVSPVANTLGGQGWRQAGELGVALTAAVGSAAGAGLLILAAEATGIYVVTLVLPIARRHLPPAGAGSGAGRTGPGPRWWR
jgi:hypothetical protein